VNSARLYGGLEVETTLDPNVQPFLRDHALDGTPLLPGVMGVETFAQLAGLLAPGYQVAAVQNVHFQRPFKFFRSQPQTLHLDATIHPLSDGDLLACTTLRSITAPARPELPVKERVHFTAEVRLARRAPSAPRREPPTMSTGQVVEREAIYHVFFHGPAYQVLERATVDGPRAVGLCALDLPANIHPSGTAEQMAPRLIELCFQTAGIWEMKTRGILALPTSIGSVTAYRPPETASGRLCAVVEAVEGGAEFNAWVVDEAGDVYVTLEGYRTVQIPGSVSL
jgi:hypothetical protein